MPMAQIQDSLAALLEKIETLSTNQKVGHDKLRLDFEQVNKRLANIENLICPKPLTNFRVFPIKEEDKMKGYIDEITKNDNFVSYLVILF